MEEMDREFWPNRTNACSDILRWERNAMGRSSHWYEMLDATTTAAKLSVHFLSAVIKERMFAWERRWRADVDHKSDGCARAHCFA